MNAPKGLERTRRALAAMPSRAAVVVGAFLVYAILPAAGSIAAEAKGAEKAAALGLKSSSHLWLEGDSTLHAYSSTATQIDVWAQVRIPPDKAADLREMARSGGFKSLTVEIPVTGLRSGKGGLDKNMYAALKAKEHPTITFLLTRYELLAHPSDQQKFLVKAAGQLSVAGQEKALELEAEAAFVTDTLAVRGSKELLMTDFGIKPPTMFFGALKTDNRVVVHFDLNLALEPGLEPNRERRRP